MLQQAHLITYQMKLWRYSDYSNYLETGSTSKNCSYSIQMDQLVLDRKEYYKEFFNKGLHSNLVSLNSEFITENEVEIKQKESGYVVSLIERVTLYGKPISTNPEEYPLIQAANWALNRTEDSEVQFTLKRYVESMVKGVVDSAKSDVEIVLTIHHEIEIRKEYNQYIFVSDSFADKSADNSTGFDNITWSEHGYDRSKPTWVYMPDYYIYNIPIEVIGQKLLDDFRNISKKSISQSSNYFTNRQHAVWYIQEYTSNPDYYHYISCDPHPSVLQDTAYYNPEYSDIWSNIGCNDCADFVSQALYYSGYPSDDYWEPDLYNINWVRTYRLGVYFDTIIDKGDFVDNLISLIVGDSAFIYKYEYADEDLNWKHVAMISKINPHRYSGHTNDRFDYVFNPDFNRYMVIEYHPIIYLPLIINGDPSYSTKQPYPDPSFRDPIVIPPYPGP